MNKSLYSILITCLLIGTSLYGMEKKNLLLAELSQPLEQSNDDPLRWGKLSLDQDCDPNIFITEILNNKDTLFDEKIYPQSRNAIARAVTYGYYHFTFAGAACYHNDLQLWEHLIKYRDDIKAKHIIDVASSDCLVLGRNPLTFAKSLEIIKLLFEKGHVSINQIETFSGESLVHTACHFDRLPNILEYCLTKDATGINRTDNFGQTPLFTLCLEGLGRQLESKYLSRALEKLAILKNAGANFFHKNKKRQTVLDIVQGEIHLYEKINQPYIHALTIFAAEIKKGMEEQEAKLEECPICFEIMYPSDEMKLTCNHIFCKMCIKRWNNTKCPLCQANTIPKNESQNQILNEWIQLPNGREIHVMNGQFIWDPL